MTGQAEAPQVALLPRTKPVFDDAVSRGGGRPGPLSARTEAVVWLSAGRADELADVLARHPALRWLQLPWAGIDAFLPVLRDHRRADLVVTRAKGAFSRPVAEHALTLTLASLRRLPLRLRATTWGDGAIGESLHGRRVTIVGAGGIATELLRLLTPFDVTTTVIRRTPLPAPGAGRVLTLDGLDGVLPETDVLVLAAAATPLTRGLLDRRRIALLPEYAVVVNVARGSLVDTDALVDALRSGRLGAAAVDVTDPEPLPDGHPLFTLDTVIVTPHAADTPAMTAPLLAERLERNTGALRGRGPWHGLVDLDAGY